MEPFGPGLVTSVQVTGPLNEPLKITPVGIPPVPLPVIVKLPPAANVAPVVRFPDVSAPVVKAKPPKSAPETIPSPPMPSTTVSAEPVRVRPAEDPVRVPPVLVKSTSPANAAKGKARASTIAKAIDPI